jgi:kinesin family protein 13
MKVIFAVYDYFGMSVQVGVRVRPFNKREEQLGSKLCIEMEGSLTHILDADGVKKSFNYDYSFWSHDGFEVDENGYNQPVGDKYSDQRKVYDEIGSSILVNAWYKLPGL